LFICFYIYSFIILFICYFFYVLLICLYFVSDFAIQEFCEYITDDSDSMHRHMKRHTAKRHSPISTPSLLERFPSSSKPLSGSRAPEKSSLVKAKQCATVSKSSVVSKPQTADSERPCFVDLTLQDDMPQAAPRQARDIAVDSTSEVREPGETPHKARHPIFFDMPSLHIAASDSLETCANPCQISEDSVSLETLANEQSVGGPHTLAFVNFRVVCLFFSVFIYESTCFMIYLFVSVFLGFCFFFRSFYFVYLSFIVYFISIFYLINSVISSCS
jgi:hypothetical protein